jgi:hypothetical protein
MAYWNSRSVEELKLNCFSKIITPYIILLKYFPTYLNIVKDVRWVELNIFCTYSWIITFPDPLTRHILCVANTGNDFQKGSPSRLQSTVNCFQKYRLVYCGSVSHIKIDVYGFTVLIRLHCHMTRTDVRVLFVFGQRLMNWSDLRLNIVDALPVALVD